MGFKSYFHTRIATSGQISPQIPKPVHSSSSLQHAKKYPCRLISSPTRSIFFGQEIVQRPHPLHRSRSISTLAISCHPFLPIFHHSNIPLSDVRSLPSP